MAIRETLARTDSFQNDSAQRHVLAWRANSDRSRRIAFQSRVFRESLGGPNRPFLFHNGPTWRQWSQSLPTVHRLGTIATTSSIGLVSRNLLSPAELNMFSAGKEHYL